MDAYFARNWRHKRNHDVHAPAVDLVPIAVFRGILALDFQLQNKEISKRKADKVHFTFNLIWNMARPWISGRDPIFTASFYFVGATIVCSQIASSRGR